MAQILTGVHSKNLSLNITMFGKVIFLEWVTEQKPLEVNNGDDGFEKGHKVDWVVQLLRFAR